MMSEADMKITPEMLERTFESLNQDTNDPKELSRNTVNLLFNDLDKNNDGKLDIEEFKKFGPLGARRIPWLPTGIPGVSTLSSAFFRWLLG